MNFSDQKFKGCFGWQLADMQRPQSWIFQFILVGNDAPFCVASFYIAAFRNISPNVNGLTALQKTNSVTDVFNPS